MKFNLDDFLQLDTTALLAVNGGTHCGGESSSSSYGGGAYSSHGGGGSHSGRGGGSCGGTTPSSGGTCGGFAPPPSPSNPLAPSVTAGGNSCGGTHSSHGCQIQNYSDTDQVASVSAEERMLTSMEKHSKESYVCTGNTSTDYRCDNWTQKTLTDAGVDYRDYYAGDAKNYTCEQHIAAKKSEYNTEVPTEKGIYVVLMNNGHQYTKKDGTIGTMAAHTGILVVDGHNSYFMDNSSGNNNGSGGVEKTMGTSAANVMSKFGYDSFYYKQVK